MVLNKGDKVIVTTSEGKLIEGEYVKATGRNGYHLVDTPEGKFTRKLNKLRKVGESETKFLENTGSTPGLSEVRKAQKFDINERFKFMEHMVRMVINGSALSMIITGEGGLGKTFTVMRQVEIKKLEKDEDYIVVKGFSTAKGLYRTLYENQDSLIFFDDCDEVLKNDTAKNIIKGALDSYEQRIVNWIVNKEDSELPSSFEFRGRIVFISNMSQDRVDNAILSRCMSVDLSMSPDDKITRMKSILPGIKPGVSMKIKEECLALVAKHMHECQNLNIRTLTKTIDIRMDKENEGVWEDMAIYTMTSTVS